LTLNCIVDKNCAEQTGELDRAKRRTRQVTRNVTRRESDTIEMTEANDVAYCGLFCGECIIKDGKIGELSQKLLRIIDAPEFTKLSKGLPIISSDLWENLKHVQEAKPVLEAMCKLDCVCLCKEGGGSSSCEIRICCKKNNLNGCWECEKMENCKVLNAISPVNQGSNIKNMRIIRKEGMKAFLSGEKHW